MSMREIILILAVCAMAVLVSGCQSPEDASAPAATQNSASATPPKPRANDTSPQTATASQQPAEGLATVASFTPPFPQRVDMFEPPQRAKSASRRTDELGEAIELKGFVNVDGPQVVLAIDGVISPIPEGGEKYGVQVIAVHPPSVVLQRGRSRWTATLE